jgi:hypothetical protein
MIRRVVHQESAERDKYFDLRCFAQHFFTLIDVVISRLREKIFFHLSSRYKTHRKQRSLRVISKAINMQNSAHQARHLMDCGAVK